MFNALESIAKAENPCTPVLGCRISNVLEPQKVSNMVRIVQNCTIVMATRKWKFCLILSFRYPSCVEIKCSILILLRDAKQVYFNTVCETKKLQNVFLHQFN